MVPTKRSTEVKTPTVPQEDREEKDLTSYKRRLDSDVAVKENQCPQRKVRRTACESGHVSGRVSDTDDDQDDLIVPQPEEETPFFVIIGKLNTDPH